MLKSKSYSAAIKLEVKLLCVKLTGEQVSYLFDEVAELLVALLHSLFAPVGFYQHLHSVHFGLVGAVVGFPNLNRTNKISFLLTNIL